jgi:hypothetical protein
MRQRGYLPSARMVQLSYRIDLPTNTPNSHHPVHTQPLTTRAGATPARCTSP